MRRYTPLRSSDSTSGRITSAAPAATEVLEYFRQLGLTLNEAWGMSELSCFATVNPPGDVRLLGVLAERDGKGLAVFRTREGARVVAAGGEVTAGTTLVAVDVSSVRLRDAAGERTVDLRRDPAAKASVPANTRAAAPKATTPPVIGRTAASAACAAPPGFSGPMLKLHGELLEGLIAQPDSWRPMLASDNGALVVREDGGFAAMIGLARGDRIAQANGIALLQPDDVSGAVLRPLVASQSVRLAGSRSGQPREIYIVNAGTCP